MGNALKYIAGGLLEGLGGGIAQNAKDLREERLRELDRQDRRDERRTDREFRASESATSRDFTGAQNDLNRTATATELAAKRNDISSTVTDTDGNLIGVSRAGEARPLGVTMKPPSGVSAEDNRLMERIEANNTPTPSTEDRFSGRMSLRPLTPEEQQAVLVNSAADLRRMGRDDLANIYLAQQPATSGQTGASGQPQGAGTQDNPFIPSTQAELDWVKQNRPGAMVSVDGKLMRVSGS